MVLHTNGIIGRLVNVFFGSAVEIFVILRLLMTNQIPVVQSTLIGLLYYNTVLVLGLCFFFGSIFSGKRNLTFSTRDAMAKMSLLVLSFPRPLP